MRRPGITQRAPRGGQSAGQGLCVLKGGSSVPEGVSLTYLLGEHWLSSGQELCQHMLSLPQDAGPLQPEVFGNWNLQVCLWGNRGEGDENKNPDHLANPLPFSAVHTDTGALFFHPRALGWEESPQVIPLFPHPHHVARVEFCRIMVGNGQWSQSWRCI